MQTSKIIGKTKRYFSRSIKVVEVGPRDGLQNEKKIIPLKHKKKLIEKLIDTGLKVVEVGSFVSSKWIPQMANTSELFSSLDFKSHSSYPCLVPNLNGLDQALKINVKEIAVFTAASESFTKKNINCSIEESIFRFQNIVKKAKTNKIKIRGYVSCVVGCPYEGLVRPETVAYVSKKLLDLGCYEISLGDTIGVGTPNSIQLMLDVVKDMVPMEKLSIHCHNTYGQAITNILTSLENGIQILDSSISGLGGCPYAPGASGNASTEDIIYCLHSLGLKTGVDLNRLMEVSRFISKILGKINHSKVTLANRVKYI